MNMLNAKKTILKKTDVSFIVHCYLVKYGFSLYSFFNTIRILIKYSNKILKLGA